MIVKEHDFKVDVIHMCFTEEGDSKLGAFFWEPLQFNIAIHIMHTYRVYRFYDTVQTA